MSLFDFLNKHPDWSLSVMVAAKGTYQMQARKKLAGRSFVIDRLVAMDESYLSRSEACMRAIKTISMEIESHEQA